MTKGGRKKKGFENRLFEIRKHGCTRRSVLLLYIYIYRKKIIVVIPRPLIGDNCKHPFPFQFFYLKLKNFLTERFLEKLFYFSERPLDTTWEHEWWENYKLVLEWEHQGVGLGLNVNLRDSNMTTRLGKDAVNGRGGSRSNRLGNHRVGNHHQIARVRLGRK